MLDFLGIDQNEIDAALNRLRLAEERLIRIDNNLALITKRLNDIIDLHNKD